MTDEFHFLPDSVERDIEAIRFDEHLDAIRAADHSRDELMQRLAESIVGEKKLNILVDGYSVMVQRMAECYDDARVCAMLEFSASESMLRAVQEAKAIGARNQKAALAREGGRARVSSDPRQTEKALIRECWFSWQSSPARYKSKAAFARDMLAKCEHLQSQKKIEDWCREWENGTQQAE